MHKIQCVMLNVVVLCSMIALLSNTGICHLLDLVDWTLHELISSNHLSTFFYLFQPHCRAKPETYLNASAENTLVTAIKSHCSISHNYWSFNQSVAWCDHFPQQLLTLPWEGSNASWWSRGCHSQVSLCCLWHLRRIIISLLISHKFSCCG